MPKPGDVCEGCSERWEDKGKEPLVLIASSGKTLVKDLPVPLCPWCDGDAVKITALDNHDPLQDA